MSRERKRQIIGQIRLGSTGSHKVEVIIRLALKMAILLRVNVDQLMLLLLY